ncbi:MAG: 50S ribosomal protein L25 [Bacteroidota bacterium]
METVAVTGQVRESLGKKSSKAIRRQGMAPAVLYGAGEPTHFSIKPLDVRALVYTPDFKLADLTIGDTKIKAIIKDIQFHPVTDEIMHIDFLALQDGHPIKVNVPVSFEGNSPGVRAGGKLQQTVRKVSMKTTPDKLVDKIILDISHLELGQAVRVRDIAPMEGVEILNPAGQPVASIEIPRALRSAATAAKKAEKEAGNEGE